MSDDIDPKADTFDRVHAFTDQLKALGWEYRVEVQESATESVRVTSLGFRERVSDPQALSRVDLEDLLDEIRERAEGGE